MYQKILKMRIFALLNSKVVPLMRYYTIQNNQDIAFKILKKEWDFNDKHGFKCIFSKGVLHLYFNFKKYKYRR